VPEPTPASKIEVSRGDGGFDEPYTPAAVYGRLGPFARGAQAKGEEHMYYLAIRQFARTLKNLDAILDKAQRYAQARNFDPNNFLTARLAPDMLPFVAQIRIACDHAKRAGASLAGKEAPVHEDNETTFEQIRARIGKCLSFLDTLTEADFEKTTPKTVIKIAFPQGKAMYADEYLFGRQIPNFYFHVTTAYALLRKGGVEIGKSDFLGDLSIIDG
jgi:hypothetical protein